MGLRNMVGFTQSASGRLWGVVNGMDGVSYDGADVQQDNPGEQVVELGLGRTYGFPFCFTAQKVMKMVKMYPTRSTLKVTVWTECNTEAQHLSVVGYELALSQSPTHRAQHR